MLLRPATVDDAPAISALIQCNLAHLTIDPSGMGAERFLEFVTPQAIRAYVELPSFRYVVAMADDCLAGVVAIRNGTHLHHLFVQPQWQRRGLGRRLWAHARQSLVNVHAGALTVNSSANAVPVYQAFGFQESGPRVEEHGVAFIPMRLVVRQPPGDP
ncbi:MAG: GNAT family N-acetyltransferase [Burkholderiaceae bacterium]